MVWQAALPNIVDVVTCLPRHEVVKEVSYPRPTRYRMRFTLGLQIRRVADLVIRLKALNAERTPEATAQGQGDIDWIFDCYAMRICTGLTHGTVHSGGAARGD